MKVALSENMSEQEFEGLSEVVVLDILENYEDSDYVIEGPNYRGTAFSSVCR